MRLLKIPKAAIIGQPGGYWMDSKDALKKILDDYELIEHRDYECHYMSGTREFHVTFYDGKESTTTMIVLRFIQYER